jgi:two-component system cell cycle sensor histidine kinase/response regulator CckA
VRPTNGDSAVGEGPRSAAETRRVRRSETLLVVDDDDAVALAAQRILEAHGYTVLSATSSSRALEIAPHHHIDLALIDLVMPDGDGPRLAEALRQVHPQMHILFMSGYETTGSLERASVARETDLIEKPFSSATLLAQVGLALAGT